MAKTVWVTRPHPQAEKTADALAKRGYVPLVSPVIELQESDAASALCQANDDDTPIIITSQYALSIIADHTRNRARKIYVTGDTLKVKAIAEGFARVYAASGEAKTIPDLLKEETSVIYAHGNHIAFDMKPALQKMHMTYKAIELYHSCATSRLRDDVINAIHNQSLSAILCYSGFSAHSMIALLKQYDLLLHAQNIPIACISQNIAEPLKKAGFMHIHISEPSAILDSLPC